ncbi:hypothetical protein MHBO_001535 [Bonamia ostreae]|uniref:Large ribosomal subunit protein uL23 N-terminal domain-containing protein n=1 Tax=Bonamia ostreae TaxID=126728 RepID=A0ABV2AKG8_9EUKA
MSKDNSAKAKNIAKIAKMGPFKKTKKVRKSVHFRLPKTLKLDRKPKYPKKAIPTKNKYGDLSLFKRALSTEKAIAEVENRNTIVMYFDNRATKHQIRRTIEKMNLFKAQKIRTLLDMTGDKKVYVRLDSEEDALAVSEKLGVF